MIYDKIVNASRYLGISKNLDQALKFMMETDLTELKNGRNEVNGDQVFVNVMDVHTNADLTREYEYHRNYYDIHLVLSGYEKVYIAEDMEDETKAYSEEADFGLGHARKEAYGLGRPGYFVVCDIEEPHLPGCADPGQEMTIHKAVIKVYR